MTEPRESVESYLDRHAEVFWNEYRRWTWRRVRPKHIKATISANQPDRFELVRNTSPMGNIIDETCQEITAFTRRECRDGHEAEMKLQFARNRAAIRAVLEVVRVLPR